MAQHTMVLPNVSPEELESIKRPPLIWVNGMPILGPFAANWDNVVKFQAREDDLLIATYPKSGTTWVSKIVDLIMNGGDLEKSQKGAIFERVPFMESGGPGFPSATEILNNLDPPRVIKTHLQADVLPKSFWEKNCKMIYVARNAKDVAVSYYHFYRMAYGHPEPGTWDEYLNAYMEGNVAFGSWAKHVKGWWEMRKKNKILYLFYEDMLEDPKREIRKVMKFMNQELPEEIVEKIHKNTSFQAMKDNPMANYSAFPLMDHSISPFMRKGICGDWKNQFTVAQNERFDEYYQKEMSDTDLTFRM
ncbi:sulfotransferase 1 family member D1-like isoform X1 [Aquarana catesbeiana]|uniref:sulfotransferase 1 family member D1-like isoform X1 n=1 Tax=Aquarana catesbeiana TaxID=8400 RepID=UPI003CC942B4